MADVFYLDRCVYAAAERHVFLGAVGAVDDKRGVAHGLDVVAEAEQIEGFGAVEF